MLFHLAGCSAFPEKFLAVAVRPRLSPGPTRSCRDEGIRKDGVLGGVLGTSSCNFLSQPVVDISLSESYTLKRSNQCPRLLRLILMCPYGSGHVRVRPQHGRSDRPVQYSSCVWRLQEVDVQLVLHPVRLASSSRLGR